MAETSPVVGLDGSEASHRVIAFVKKQAALISDCHVIACFVIEWSPFSFQSAEANEQRHRRREEEIGLAHEKVLDPALRDLTASGLDVTGTVLYGDAADLLDRLAVKHNASQIVVGRVGVRGLREHIFGGVSGRLVAQSLVPVTIVP